MLLSFFKDNFYNSYPYLSYGRFVYSKRGRKIMMFRCKCASL